MTNDGHVVERSFDAGEVVITYAEIGGSGTPCSCSTVQPSPGTPSMSSCPRC